MGMLMLAISVAAILRAAVVNIVRDYYNCSDGLKYAYYNCSNGLKYVRGYNDLPSH
jgi:hypothetical protein